MQKDSCHTTLAFRISLKWNDFWFSWGLPPMCSFIVKKNSPSHSFSPATCFTCQSLMVPVSDENEQAMA